jgi:hypothetical protein
MNAKRARRARKLLRLMSKHEDEAVKQVLLDKLSALGLTKKQLERADAVVADQIAKSKPR